MVNDVEFIINFARAKEAVQRLATTDKVEYFGNLIRNGYLQGNALISKLERSMWMSSLNWQVNLVL